MANEGLMRIKSVKGAALFKGDPGRDRAGLNMHFWPEKNLPIVYGVRT